MICPLLVTHFAPVKVQGDTGQVLFRMNALL